MPDRQNFGASLKCRIRICALAAIAILLSIPTICSAANYYWNVASGDWSTAANWQTGIEPTSSDTGYIENSGTASITQSGETCTYLYLGATNIGTIDMTNGSLTVLYHEYIGNSNTGSFTHSGGTNSIINDLYLGFNSGGKGIYNLNDSGQLSASQELIGLYGTGTFTQTGGTNSLGGVVTTGHLTLGRFFGSRGTYNLSGTGQLSAWGEIIGSSGIGTFEQTDGTNKILGSLNLGLSYGSTGTYNLSGTGQLTVGTEEKIGNYGTGTFTQTGGTNKILRHLSLGLYSGSSGTYNLSGTGQLTADSEDIGRSGTGTFTQTGGTNSIAYDLYLGSNSYSASGTYNLSGTGQLSAGTEKIGYYFYGTGTFIHTGGTNTISSSLELGFLSGSSGTYNLSGTGQLSASSEYIGIYGTGTFTQTSGTNSITNALYLGQSSGSNGTYNLNGGTLILKSLDKGTGGTATFNFGGGTLQASDSFTCSLGMTLTGTDGNANVDTAGFDVTLSGILSGTGGLNKLGSGTLSLSGSETYSGNTTVNGGTLIFSSGISASGTSLIDVESGSAVFKTTNISKTDLNVYTAASATFEVLNGSHQLGAIDGSGATRIDDGATLIVASIHQGGLYIGNGAKLAIQGTSGNALDRDVIASVPEPGTWILLATALISPWFYARRWRKKLDTSVEEILLL